MNIQLFGKTCPPYYGVEDAVAVIDKIADIDVKINELLIQREAYVTDLKEKLAKTDSTKA